MESRSYSPKFTLLAVVLLLGLCKQRSPTPPVDHAPAPAQVQKAIEIAVEAPSVKEAISSQPYEVGEVRQLDPSEPGVLVVAIHMGKRELPGISLSVVVDIEQRKMLTANRHLRPRQLAEGEKAEARRIALSDPEVLETIGDKAYEITRIEEFAWSEGSEFLVYPAVNLNVPPDRRLEGFVLWVCVDLEAKRVVTIISKPRKPMPPRILR